MRRMLVLLLALMLCIPAALAAEVTLSPAMEAERIAIAALKDKYGLTNDLFGLFTAYVTEADGVTCVRYRSAAYLPAQIVGEYEVCIQGSQVTASWTHDGQDPMYWQSDMLDAPCWGARQLNRIRVSHGDGMDDYLPMDQLPDPLPEKHGDLVFERTEPAVGDLPIADALALVDAAIQAVYNLPPEEIRLLNHTFEPDMLLASDGQRLWHITLSDPERLFSVMINAATGEIFDVTLSTGGLG